MELPQYMYHPIYGLVKILSIGHFPTSVMIETERKQILEIEANELKAKEQK
jgi:hypothetical protein